ncbi:NFX1-type zinc finger-containing protein 1-like protein [Aphelenchoides avenae]|nr:NFX1-type zinc finger-containing protein 1-like protein [Aphelenchus avenae]
MDPSRVVVVLKPGNSAEFEPSRVPGRGTDSDLGSGDQARLGSSITKQYSAVFKFSFVQIVGMTTTGAAMHQVSLCALKPRIVIVEEAAEVFEAHILTSLTAACQHVILIGGRKQLRQRPAVNELASKYKFDPSLFERLIINGHLPAPNAEEAASNAYGDPTNADSTLLRRP